jgi:hypothetical protein
MVSVRERTSGMKRPSRMVAGNRADYMLRRRRPSGMVHTLTELLSSPTGDRVHVHAPLGQCGGRRHSALCSGIVGIHGRSRLGILATADCLSKQYK